MAVLFLALLGWAVVRRFVLSGNDARDDLFVLVAGAGAMLWLSTLVRRRAQRYMLMAASLVLGVIAIVGAGG